MDFGKFLFNILYRDKIDNDGIKLEEEVNQIADIIAQRSLDSIVMGKKEFLLAVDVMVLPAGYDLASLRHTIMSNVKFRLGEFNLIKELRASAEKACMRLGTNITKLHNSGKSGVYLLYCHFSFGI